MLTRAFIIEFEYAGRVEFANVVEYKGGFSIFHVAIISGDEKRDTKLILKQTGDKIELAENSPTTDENLAKVVSANLQKRPYSN
jgi:hypothetical protein